MVAETRNVGSVNVDRQAPWQRLAFALHINPCVYYRLARDNQAEGAPRT